ncbi:Swarming motility protein YbiA [compost metagenome]
MNYDNSWLTEKFKSKEKIKYLFFWGHQPSKDGSITQSCFSQWWQSPFELNDITYKTAEHWMMAEKARLFGDSITLEKILKAKTPAEAKKMGRLVNHFNPAIWDSHKFQIVVNGNFHKFSQHEGLKSFLINTKDRVLVEASPVDNIWGIGMAADHDHIENPLKWKGENLLGYALMEVRDKLK